jgi:hypothetical protein
MTAGRLSKRMVGNVSLDTPAEVHLSIDNGVEA